MNKLIVFTGLMLGMWLNPHIAVGQNFPQTPEMQEQIKEIKMEIKELEEEIKLVEQSDPEEAKMLKTELATMKSMLQMLDPSAAKKTISEEKAVQTKNVAAIQTIKSPIVPVILKQPASIPTPQQLTDNLLWYKGKKVNDSTLITGKGMVVQLSRKRNMVKLQPEKKADPFAKIVQEIEKNEQRKEELVVSIDKMKNGFLYYPELMETLEAYDKMAKVYGDLVKNTIELPELPDFSSPGYKPSPSGHGPNASENFYNSTAEEETLDNVSQYFNQKIERAKKLASELPPVGEFPAPPTHELGMCIDCDSTAKKKQDEQDSIWYKKYSGKESEILMLLLEAERAKALLNANAVTKDTTSYLYLMKAPITSRIKEKNKLLYDRYGKDIRYKDNVYTTILGFERQSQLLGMVEENEGSHVGEMAVNGKSSYEKYFDEQADLKNHDFVLNLSRHLGVARQAALLGDEDGSYFGKMIDKFLKYNRFALSAEIDFIYEERTDDNELEFKATGKLETTVKQFIMFYPIKCNFKVQPYNLDYFKEVDISDISIPFTVISGVKTQHDEKGNLVNYQYSGPPEYPLMFPDFKIDFCNTAKPDTAYFFTFTGNEDAASMAQANTNALNTSYKSEMISFANFVFQSDNDTEENEDDLQNMGMDMMKTIVGFQTESPADTKLGQLKQSYEGNTKMDNYRKGMQGMMTSKKSQFLFTANNRSTVLVDKYNDSKREMEEGVKLTRGMVHLRVVHQPGE